MKIRMTTGPLAILSGLAVQGCSYLGSARDFNPAVLRKESGWVAVNNIAPRRQASREDRGIAASEMVLAHYEVAVAVHAEQQRIVTLDPANGWRSNSIARFLEEWKAAARLTLLVFPADGGP
jgi:hypothetical protein